MTYAVTSLLSALEADGTKQAREIDAKTNFMLRVEDSWSEAVCVGS